MLPVWRLPILAMRSRVLHIEDWYQCACAELPRSRRSASHRRLLSALMDCAIQKGATKVEESYRELAERAGMSLGTVAKRIKELEAWVLIEPSKVGGRERSTFTLRMSMKCRDAEELAVAKDERSPTDQNAKISTVQRHAKSEHSIGTDRHSTHSYMDMDCTDLRIGHSPMSF